VGEEAVATPPLTRMNSTTSSFSAVHQLGNLEAGAAEEIGPRTKEAHIICVGRNFIVDLVLQVNSVAGFPHRCRGSLDGSEMISNVR
jgi:hypothetical protein